MSASIEPDTDRRPVTVLLVIALVAAIADFVFVWTLPLYTLTTSHLGAQPRVSIESGVGPLAAWLGAIPVVTAIVVWTLLRATPRNWKPGSSLLAFLTSVLLGLAALVGTVTILVGAFVLPVAGLLAVASRMEWEMATRVGAASPGWYADPMAPGHMRWFDGERWTQHVTP